MAIERKPLKKAPARDVVEAFTANPEQPQSAGQAASAAPAVPSRGPGRPRSKRRMEPFSSKIEIGLRDEVDAYLAENGGTIIDFLDEALRARLAK
ncbi:hypothetical protein VH571_15025 [Frondihabitans sp. 4ASC-45]|uniref:hypothetical protein n=1 Tax=Frondihabitans sp. 4ASC-45 TaxID=3111636 RepID=UPI003C13CB52